jgi:hypothetical protein
MVLVTDMIRFLIASLSHWLVGLVSLLKSIETIVSIPSNRGVLVPHEKIVLW